MKKAYINGDILTMDRRYSNAEVVLTDGEIITAVGGSELLSEEDIKSVIDLKGKTLLPGFVVRSHLKTTDTTKLGITTLINDYWKEYGNIILDGELRSKKAYLSTPYYVVPNGELLSYSGIANYKYMDIKKFINHTVQGGHNIYAIANGSGAIELFLNAYEKVYAKGKTINTRCVISGCEDVKDNQLDRIGMLKIYIEYHPWSIFKFGDYYAESVLGEGNIEKVSPMRSCAVKGIPFLLGIGEYSVIENLQFAVLRRTSKDRLLGKNERITPLRAINAVTMSGAKMLGLDNEIGSITPNKRADFVILSDNPCKVKKSVISKIKVLKTIKNGQTVYKNTNY